MGGRPSIVFIFVNKQSQQARKTLLCHYCFQYGGKYMANSRTFAAIYGLFLLLEIAVLTLKHIEKKIDTLYILDNTFIIVISPCQLLPTFFFYLKIK